MKCLQRLQTVAVQRVSGRHRGQQLAVLVIFGAIIPSFEIQCTEPGEDQHRARGAENIDIWGRSARRRPGARGFDIDRGSLGPGVGHLAGQHSGPDEAVQPVLVAGEGSPERLRVPPDPGGANGFVRFLGGLGPGGKGPGLVREKVLAVPFPDIRAGFGDGALRHLGGVGSHVGDQPDRAFAGNVDSFVKLLGHDHRALGGETQLPAGFLLHGAGGERSGRPLADVPLLDLSNGITRAFQLRLIGPCLIFSGNLDGPPLSLEGPQGGGEGCRLGTVIGCLVEFGVDGPRLHGNEGFDLPLAIGDHAQGYGLDPSSRKTPLDAAPQERADLVSNQPVEDAPGLLGIDQAHIYFPGMLEGFFHRLLGDFVEDNPLGRLLVLVPSGGGLDMPGYGLALAVGVSGKING